MNQIIIRRERPKDEKAILKLTYEAFTTLNFSGKRRIDEHYLVHLLKHSAYRIPELCFVAELGGEIVGHILYTKSMITRKDGTTVDVVTFGPLSVHPHYQKQGIGKALVNHTKEIAKEMGFGAIIIIGVPKYYPKLGFKQAGSYSLIRKGGDVGYAFMAYELADGVLDGGGLFEFLAPEYEIADQDEEGYIAFHRAFMQEFYKDTLCLRPLFDDDIGLLEKWLNTDHVKPWYEPIEDWLFEIKSRFGEFQFLSHFIAEWNGIPIGFCQYYDMYDGQEHEDWRKVDKPGILYSIDYLVGNPLYLKKSFGKGMVLLMLEKLRKEGVKQVIVRPDKNNTSSNRTLESVGFQWDGEDYLMEL